jgi:hypothetical protein
MKAASVIVVLAVLGYLLFPALTNVWYLVIDTQDVYHIPAGSSLFTFRPTEMNSGSGDWWIYGEDNHHYYYFEDDIMISKQVATTCSGFSKTDLSTWC